jgi:3-phenylpropionate/trans-cinnamate dioxygenase ferredoxin component
MGQFVPVCKVSELPDPGRMVVEVDDRLVGLFHVAGQYYAIDDMCTHDGGPLADGVLDGYAIVCPRHGARFDIRTGRVLAMPATQDTASHEVKVEGDDVMVRVKGE